MHFMRVEPDKQDLLTSDYHSDTNLTHLLGPQSSRMKLGFCWLLQTKHVPSPPPSPTKKNNGPKSAHFDENRPKQRAHILGNRASYQILRA